MMEQTLLDNIKDEAAQACDYKDWSAVPIDVEGLFIDEVAKKYATACIEASLKKAAENENVDTMQDEHGRLYILKSSIESKDNHCIL